MPIILVLLGVALISAAWRGQEGKLADVLKDDFTGDNNFAAWLLAIVILGVLGSAWEPARPFADAFLVLVIVALLVSQNGFWDKLKQAVLT